MFMAVRKLRHSEDSRHLQVQQWIYSLRDAGQVLYAGMAQGFQQFRDTTVSCERIHLSSECSCFQLRWKECMPVASEDWIWIAVLLRQIQRAPQRPADLPLLELSPQLDPWIGSAREGINLWCIRVRLAQLYDQASSSNFWSSCIACDHLLFYPSRGLCISPQHDQALNNRPFCATGNVPS